jgi:hypothetical protein
LRAIKPADEAADERLMELERQAGALILAIMAGPLGLGRDAPLHVQLLARRRRDRLQVQLGTIQILESCPIS